MTPLRGGNQGVNGKQIFLSNVTPKTVQVGRPMSCAATFIYFPNIMFNFFTSNLFFQMLSGSPFSPLGLHRIACYSVPGKSNYPLQTTCNRNVTTAPIWIKFRTLNSHQISEAATKFRAEKLFRIIAILLLFFEILITKYLRFQYKVTALTRLKVISLKHSCLFLIRCLVVGARFC